MQQSDQDSPTKPRAKRHKPKHGAPPLPRAAAAAAAPADSSDLPMPDGGVHVDGSLLEGGGQILRNASALSAILRRPIKVDRIRAGRDKPGLRPQHLTGLQLLAEFSGGQLAGGQVGSSCITLRPGGLACGRHVADTRTAGSCTLLAQSALPALLFAAGSGGAAVGGGDTALAAAPAGPAAAAEAAAAEEPAAPGSTAAAAATPAAGAGGEHEGAGSALLAALQAGRASELDLRGGTDAAMAPPAGYLQHVLLPVLRARLGVRAHVQLVRRGFFPRGQGQVLLTVAALPPGGRLPALDLTQRGDVARIDVRAFTAGRVVPSMGDRLAAAAVEEIKAGMPRAGVPRSVPIHTHVAHEPVERAVGDGCAVLVTAESTTGCLFGATGLGERGVPAEDVGARAAGELLDALRSGACTDEWLQDQLVIFMALAEGRSRVLTGEPTLHTRTACMVAQALTGARFSIKPGVGSGSGGRCGSGGGGSGGLFLIECEGAGVAAPP